MMKEQDFAVFILTYGRADNVVTYKILKKQNYTGKIYLVCSTDDPQLEEYKKRYGDEVIVFDKDEYKDSFDLGDNFNEKRAVIFPRNAVFDIAEKLGYTYFLQLDDDYSSFCYTLDENERYITLVLRIKNLDRLFDNLLDYYKKIPAKTLAIAQGGDFIGGRESGQLRKRVLRKAMNFFICSTKRKFNFVGRINEDVNTYVSLGNQGELLLTIVDIRLDQGQTQSTPGGMTEMYLDSGTYLKSFYTILFAPSCVYISLMGNKNKRLHHQIQWRYAVPKLIKEKYKK